MQEQDNTKKTFPSRYLHYNERELMDCSEVCLQGKNKIEEIRIQHSRKE